MLYIEEMNKIRKEIEEKKDNIITFMEEVRSYSRSVNMDEEITEDYIFEVVTASINDNGYSGVINFKGGEVSVDEIGVMELGLQKILKK